MSGKRIFTKEELADFSKDCMDLALEALEKGDVEKARKWCRKQKETKDCIHDLYLHWITALLSTIYDRWGEESAVSVLKETSCLGPSGWSAPFLAERERLLKEKGISYTTVEADASGVLHLIYFGFSGTNGVYPVRYGECASNCTSAPRPRMRSNFDAEPHLGESVGGNLEKVRRAAGNPREEREDRKRNRRHRRMLCAAGNDFMRNIIVHVLQIGGEPQHLAVLERQRDIRRLHEAEPHVDVIDAVAEAFDRVPLPERNSRPPVGDEGHQHQGLVHHAVVLDVMQQHRGRAMRHFRQPHAHAGRARHHHVVDIVDELLQRHRHLLQPLVHER